jgi:hypothetical protein
MTTYCETHGVNLVQNERCMPCENGIEVTIIAGDSDGHTAEESWLEGFVYLDVSINGDNISGWVRPTTAAVIKGMDKKNCLASGNVVAELHQIGIGMQAAGKAMREATFELQAKQRLIESYREKTYAQKRLIGKLLELLNNDDLDAARDLVKYEYDGIHGPAD